MIIDLHTHPHPNSDGASLSSVQPIVDTKLARLGTVRDTEFGRPRGSGYIGPLSRTSNLTVTPGCEVTMEDGHVVVLGAWKATECERPVADDGDLFRELQARKFSPPGLDVS